jgi:hypothetical protein
MNSLMSNAISTHTPHQNEKSDHNQLPKFDLKKSEYQIVEEEKTPHNDSNKGY